MHAPHHVPQEWADRYKGMFDDGWDAYRELSSSQQELGIVPPDGVSRARPTSRHGIRCPRTRPPLRPDDGGVCRFPLAHRPPHRAAGRLPREDRPVDNTLSWSSPTTAPRGRRSGRVDQREPPLQQRPRDPGGTWRQIDESAALDFNHYPWGWAWAGNTPFRRWKRETYRGGVTDPFIVHWPKGILRAVRAQFAHVVDMVPTVLEALGIDRPGDSGGHPVADRGGQLRAHFDDAKAPTRYTPSTSRCSVTADLSRRLACSVSGPGPSFAEAGGFGTALTGTTWASSTPKAGSYTTSPRLRRRPGPRRGAPPPTGRADRDLVHRGRQVQRAADR